MDFDLNEDQLAIVDSVQRLLDQQAGPARAIELNQVGEYDWALESALDVSGFNDIARDFGDGGKPAGLAAALTVEAIARAGGVVSCAARQLALPAVSEQRPEGSLALCTRAEIDAQTPIRFAAHARHLLVLEPEGVTLLPLAENSFEPVRTSFGYPMGRAVSGAQLDTGKGEHIGGADLARTLCDWWRLSLAVEAVGTMDAALQQTAEYLKQRRQFGRAIGSFQAVQHRLAQCAIDLEASRWLAREAAYHGAPTEATAAAAAFALQAADRVFTETHQLSGAIGFTHEFDLHVWSMRLLALRQELDGVGGARRALVRARWTGDAW